MLHACSTAPYIGARAQPLPYQPGLLRAADVEIVVYFLHVFPSDAPKGLNNTLTGYFTHKNTLG